MADWKDIWNDNERPLSDDELLQYIHAQTGQQDKQQIEEIATDDFEADALQGLQLLQNPEHAKRQVNDLKKQLHKHLRSRKKRTNKSPKPDAHFILYAIIILLITCVLVYTVVKMLRQ